MATPPSTAEEANKKIREGGNNQNLKLFIRGKAISGADNIKGINQLPNPPINTGITKKKIIRKACAVTTVLYTCSPKKDPGTASSVRIKILIVVPTKPPQIPMIKYKVPISLWLVEVNH